MRACKHCPRTTSVGDDQARVQGWRWFSGVSQTGKPLDDVMCPVCAGYEEEAATGPEYQVGCNACHWVYEPDADEDKILDGKSALQVADDHECEPDVWIRLPHEEEYRAPYEFDYKTGELRKALVSA